MSKMPALARSFHSTSSKTCCSGALEASAVATLKSGTASRIFSTPSPVPVRIQSWEKAGRETQTRSARKTSTGVFLTNRRIDLYRITIPGSSPIIEPELHRDLAAVVVGRQPAESVDTLDGASRRNVQRRNAARLLYLHVGGLPIAQDVEGDVHPLPAADPGIDLVLQPVLRDLAPHHVHVPSEAAAKISVARETQSPFGAPGGEHAVGPADGPALAEGNNVLRFRLGRFLGDGRALRLRGLFSRVPFGDGDGFRRLLLLPRQRFRESRRFVRHDALAHFVGRQRDGSARNQ